MAKKKYQRPTTETQQTDTQALLSGSAPPAVIDDPVLQNMVRPADTGFGLGDVLTLPAADLDH